jgi:hypothetical protein
MLISNMFMSSFYSITYDFCLELYALFQILVKVGPKWVFIQGSYQIELAELKPQSGLSKTLALTEGTGFGQFTCCKPGSPHRSDPLRAHYYKVFGPLLCTALYSTVLYCKSWWRMVQVPSKNRQIVGRPRTGPMQLELIGQREAQRFAWNGKTSTRAAV